MTELRNRPTLALLLALLCAPPVSHARADADETIVLRLGEARAIPFLSAPSRLYLDTPELAELRVPQPNQAVLTPRAIGFTTLHALGTDGSVIATIDLDIEPAASGAEETALANSAVAIRISLHPAQTQSLPLVAPAERVFIEDPEIAAVMMTAPDRLLVRGKAAGSTLLYALDPESKRVGLYQITVAATDAAMPAPTAPTGLAGASTPTDWVTLTLPEGRLVDLPRPATSAISDNTGIADTRMQPPARVFIFGRSPGETTVRVSDATGALVARIRVTVSGTSAAP